MYSYALAACFPSDWVRETGRSTRWGPRLGHGDLIWSERASLLGVHGWMAGSWPASPSARKGLLLGSTIDV